MHPISVMCAVRCVLCALNRALCAVCCVQSAGRCVLCAVRCVLCAVHCVLCAVCRALCAERVLHSEIHHNQSDAAELQCNALPSWTSLISRVLIQDTRSKSNNF